MTPEQMLQQALQVGAVSPELLQMLRPQQPAFGGPPRHFGTLSPETLQALGAPMLPQNMPPVPIVGNAIPSPPAAPVRELLAEPVTPPPPQARANAAPQNLGEANWWDRMLAAAGRRLVESGAGSERFMTPRDVAQLPGFLRDPLEERNAAFLAMTADEGRRRAAYPPLPVDVTPPPEPDAQGPNAPDESGAGAAGGGGSRYPRFEGREPDFTRVLEAYERGRPRQRERDPEERTLRLIASALGGMVGRSGVDVASGTVAGLGAGYARESDRDEALWQRDEESRSRFELGLAGLLGQQEQAQFNNAMARQGFDRTSMMAEDADARAREGLALQRENAGGARMLQQLRIASLARQLGMGSDPAQILARGVDALIRSPGAQIIVDGRPLTLDVDGQQMTLGQLRAAINARRTDVQTRFMTNPTAYNNQIAAEISDRFMRGFMRLTPDQQRQVLMQIGGLSESRPRSGSTQVNDE